MGVFRSTSDKGLFCRRIHSTVGCVDLITIPMNHDLLNLQRAAQPVKRKVKRLVLNPTFRPLYVLKIFLCKLLVYMEFIQSTENPRIYSY